MDFAMQLNIYEYILIFYYFLNPHNYILKKKNIHTFQYMQKIFYRIQSYFHD